MKLDKYTLTEKKFYTTRKELDKLWETMRNLPYRTLDEPYQDGWRLNIILRDDISRSSKAPAIEFLLDKFAITQTTKNPKHISQIRKNPTIEFLHKLNAHKRFSQYHLGIRDIDDKEYNKLSDTHKKYFNLVSPFISKHRYGSRIMYECNIPSYYFVVKTNKRMITKVQDIDPVLKKKEAELQKILEPYWRTTSQGEGYYHYFEMRKERRRSRVELSKISMED